MVIFLIDLFLFSINLLFYFINDSDFSLWVSGFCLGMGVAALISEYWENK